MSRTYLPKALRERVAEAAKYRCGYCLSSEAIIGAPMEIDHHSGIVGRAHGRGQSLAGLFAVQRPQIGSRRGPGSGHWRIGPTVQSASSSLERTLSLDRAGRSNRRSDADGSSDCGCFEFEPPVVGQSEETVGRRRLAPTGGLAPSRIFVGTSHTGLSFFCCSLKSLPRNFDRHVTFARCSAGISDLPSWRDEMYDSSQPDRQMSSARSA